MTDKEITREKTFSEELLHFKERIKEVLDNYNNPNGNEDPLYICVLRDSKRIVRKAEEEIARKQTEIENLQNVISNQQIEISVKIEKQIKTEAYKAFAENAVIRLTNNYHSEYAHWIDDTIYSLLKEIAGEEE